MTISHSATSRPVRNVSVKLLQKYHKSAAIVLANRKLSAEYPYLGGNQIIVHAAFWPFYSYTSNLAQ